jgi:hypothetical protein
MTMATSPRRSVGLSRNVGTEPDVLASQLQDAEYEVTIQVSRRTAAVIDSRSASRMSAATS